MTRTPRRAVVVLIGLAVVASPCTTAAQADPGGGRPGAEAALASTPPQWELEVAGYTYVLPDEANYLQPAVKADRGWLHLEGRFNYEDRDTASAWLGYNVTVGERVSLEVTPMVGVVFGATDGVAPGYAASLAWRALELSSETEFVFDADSRENDFLYTWSELTVSPREWWRTGLVVQRTKAYQTAFDIQRGVLVGVTYKAADVSAYVFLAREGRPTIVVAAAFTFAP